MNKNINLQYGYINQHTEEYSPTEGHDPEYLKFLFNKIKQECEQTYLDYLTGLRSNYLFSEDEFDKLLQDSTVEYIQSILDGLIDKDLTQVLVKQDGAIGYGLTEKGKQLASQLHT